MNNTWTMFGVLQGVLTTGGKESAWFWYDDRDEKWKQDPVEFYTYQRTLTKVSSTTIKPYGTGTEKSTTYGYSNGRTDGFKIDPELFTQGTKKFGENFSVRTFIRFPPEEPPQSRFELMEID